MAIDFPSSPSLNQLFSTTSNSYIWNGVQWVGYTTSTAPYADSAGIATYLSDAANILTGTINKDRISTTNSLDIIGNLYVSNNISFGGTTTQLNTQQLQIIDPDIVLGIGTSFSPTDYTANHGGIAIASTEGTPIVNLNIIPTETNPYTYKKIMWFKGSTIGVGLTDAWLFNYGVGIGSTQVPNGVRLAVGGIHITENDIFKVANINASGIITATTFIGNLTGTATTATNVVGGIGSLSSLQVNGSATIDNDLVVKTQNLTSETHKLNTQFKIKTITGNYTVLRDDGTILINGTLKITMPTCIGFSGDKYFVKNVGVGTVTIVGFGTETIDGYSQMIMSEYNSSMYLLSNGLTGWYIL